VEVTTAAWPGRTFPARIVYVGDILDPASRTVRARVELENADGALKPGMFATAFVATAAGSTTVAVPRDAVQNVEGSDVVWRPGDEPGGFVASPVLLGRELPGGLVEVTAGLVAGDSLVVQGAFTLKAELARGEFGGHGH
jgi:cobalt-zinc-cadmium efflux system membrane fusion protein